MIGIYGGTFDPIHFGHLRTALEVKEIFALDEIRLIPCFIPPHRDSPSAPASMRLRMLELALEDRTNMTVDTREIDRGGPSYMVETLMSLRAEIGERPLLLFIGADAFTCLTAWYQWQRLFEFAHVVVMTRPGFNAQVVDGFLTRRLTENRQALKEHSAGHLFFQSVTRLEISATAIRQIIAKHRDPGFLLPESVIQYIRQHKLYQR
ncbi:MAG TPA: nicotinic acid mononucleotide adenylyltransferase [Methylococcaceae bacterium]|nr:nicotinic acid mononucleotide adenylyltransferase [Methylococcaceae bacterium]